MQKPTSVEEYLSWAPDDHRAHLDALRATIKEVAPEAEEVITYGMPGFRLDGKFFASYSDFKNHVSLFPATQYVRETLREDVKPYFSGKGTFRFDVTQPLPTGFVRRVVELLLEEKIGR